MAPCAKAAQPVQITEHRVDFAAPATGERAPSRARDHPLRVPRGTGAGYPDGSIAGFERKLSRSELERRRRIDRALLAVALEANVNGVSIRKVDADWPSRVRRQERRVT